MINYLNEINKKIEELNQIIVEYKTKLQDVPPGVVQVFQRKGHYQYYHYYKRGKKNIRKYINRDESDLAYKLAQSDYNKRILRMAEEQLVHLQKEKLFFEKNKLEEVYQLLNENRKHLVTPIEDPFEEFIARWEKSDFKYSNSYPIETEIYTNKGEQVRSKSECIIANELCRHGIPYRYESPLHIKGLLLGYPDFTVINRNTRQIWYWEHLGLLDDSEYLSHTLTKMDRYISNGILPGKNLILTYEKKDNPLKTRSIEIMIQEYLI